MSVFRIHAPPATGGVSRKADTSLVRAALATLVDPASAFELRALRKIPGTTKAIPRYEVFAPGKLAEAVRFCERANADGFQVYVNLNPVSPELVGPDRKATDATVLCRRWLMVDVDPLRDAAHKDDSATDEEKELAREIAVVLLDRLTQQGWPLPILADSGNGFHLLYRVELPNNDHARLLCRSVLKGLEQDTAGLDTKTYNASRICKVPGTWAMKGEESSERPFRMAKILHCPETLEPVPVELLSAWLPTSTPPPAPPPRQETGSTFRVHAVNGMDKSARERLYVRKTFEACISRVILATPGGEGGTGRNDCLFKSAARLGEFIASGHLLRQEVEEALRSAARRVGLYEDSGCGEHGVESTIRSGISHGLTQPWPGLPDDDNVRPGAQAKPEPPNPGEVIILRASSVTPRRVEWLWPGRIPLGKLTTFAGVGGLGKTFVLCDISARVTTGREWPDAPDVPTERGSVLFISGEDDPDDTLVPRLIEAKADLHRVCFLTASAAANFTLAAIGVLTQALGQIGDDTRLVVIDPPTSYLAGVDDHKNAELRGLLSPLAAWAAEKRLAIVFNTHVNKPQGSKVEAMMRVMGSVAWVNAVRAAHMFAKDPEDNSKRIFVGMKSNLGRERKGLAYKIVSDSQDDDGPARVEWLGAVDTTADQAVSQQQQQPKRGEVASEWLIERFRECRQWRSDDLFRAARESGISRSAVFDAKRRLELPKARKVTRQDGNEDWYWWVPDDWPQLVQSHTGTEPVEPVEPLETEAQF